MSSGVAEFGFKGFAKLWECSVKENREIAADCVESPRFGLRIENLRRGGKTHVESSQAPSQVHTHPPGEEFSPPSSEDLLQFLKLSLTFKGEWEKMLWYVLSEEGIYFYKLSRFKVLEALGILQEEGGDAEERFQAWVKNFRKEMARIRGNHRQWSEEFRREMARLGVLLRLEPWLSLVPTKREGQEETGPRGPCELQRTPRV